LQQIREQRLMQLREDNGQYGNYSGTEVRLYEVSPDTYSLVSINGVAPGLSALRKLSRNGVRGD